MPITTNRGRKKPQACCKVTSSYLSAQRHRRAVAHATDAGTHSRDDANVQLRGSPYRTARAKLGRPSLDETMIGLVAVSIPRRPFSEFATMQQGAVCHRRASPASGHWHVCMQRADMPVMAAYCIRCNSGSRPPECLSTGNAKSKRRSPR